jgi:hypothetical protein
MRDYLFKERLTLVTGYHLINGRDDGPKVLVRFLYLLLLLIASSFCVVIFHVLFEVSLLVEVRLRASFSAPKRTPVANDAPALFSALSCFSFDNNKPPKQ